MDPNNLHPDIKARLDTVMNTPTKVPPPPVPVSPTTALSPDKEAILAQKQDANELRMPSAPLTISAPMPQSPPPPPAKEAITAPLPTPTPQATPQPAAAPVHVDAPKQKGSLSPVLLFLGGIVFFGAYTVLWVYIFMPQVFQGGK